MNSPEMQLQATQDVFGTPSLATNTLMATAGLISQTFLSIYKTIYYEGYFSSCFFLC
jgi:hypothetical protein